MPLHAINPSVPMRRRRQQCIQRVQVAHFAECAVGEAQPARRPAKPFIHGHVRKGNLEIDVLAGDDKGLAGHRQVDGSNAGGAPIEVLRLDHISPAGVYKEMSKSNAVAASSPTAPSVSGSAATNSCRSLAGSSRTDSS